MSWVDVDGVGQESKQVPIGVSLSTTDNFVCDISVDSSGYPHIVYEGLTGTTTNIYYIQWNGTSWVDADGTGQESSNISNTTTACTFPTLKLDPSGRPRVVWIENSTVAYLQWNGTTWTDADGTGQESMILSFTTAASWKPDLCLDSTGNPNIVFNYETGTSPVIGNVGFIKWNGSAWVDADGSGQESMSVFSNQYPAPAMLISLALDSHDRPHVSFNWGVMPLDVYYFQWNGSAWVDANGTVQYPMFVYQYPGLSQF